MPWRWPAASPGASRLVSACRASLAPALVASFKQQVPEVMVHLQDMTSAIQQERLLSGQLQLGFMRRPQAPQLQEHRLLTDRLVLAVPTLMTQPDPAAFDVEQALASQPCRWSATAAPASASRSPASSAPTG